MPVFTNPISNQNQSSTAGIQNYPTGNTEQQYGSWYDCFNRETLNPSGTWAMYTVSNGQGNGTAAIESDGADWLISTSGATGDNTTGRTSGHILKRTSLDSSIDSRGAVTEIDIVFTKVQSTSVKGFIGLVAPASGGAITALTALPTSTPGHMGVYWDSSVDGNMYLTSSDATTQTTVSMGAVGASTMCVLKIFWKGTSSATISLGELNGGLETGIGIKTVSALQSGDIGSGYQLQCFVNTLANASKFIRVYEIRVKYN